MTTIAKKQKTPVSPEYIERIAKLITTAQDARQVLQAIKHVENETDARFIDGHNTVFRLLITQGQRERACELWHELAAAWNLVVATEPVFRVTVQFDFVGSEFGTLMTSSDLEARLRKIILKQHPDAQDFRVTTKRVCTAQPDGLAAEEHADS